MNGYSHGWSMKLLSCFSRLLAAVLIWAVVLPVSASNPAPAGGCLVSAFKTLALRQNDVPLRIEQASQWLQKNMGLCTPQQLSAIQSNSPSWLGHALTPQLAGLIEGAIEARNAGNPALMGQLYESLGQERRASLMVHRNPLPRAPVVQPVNIQGGLSGSVNYGNISGPTTAIVNQNTSQSSSQNSNQSQNLNQTAVQSPGATPSPPAGQVNQQNAVQQQGQAAQSRSR